MTPTGRTRADTGRGSKTATKAAGTTSGKGAGKPARQRTQPAAGAFAAGAERATGERRRRTGTPLLPPVGPVEVSTARRAVAAMADGEQAPPPGAVVEAPSSPEGGPAPRRRPSRAQVRSPRPSPGPDGGAGLEGGAGDERPPAGAEPIRRTRLRAVPTGSAEGGAVGDAAGVEPSGPAASAKERSRAEQLMGAVLEAAEFSSDVRPGPAELVELAVNVLRAAAASSGLPAEDVERQVAETLAYLRRRLTGEVSVDEFGFDRDWTTHVHLPVLRTLYRAWFRVEVKGVENIPSEGGALVVANHSGTVALDSLMAQVAVHDEHPAHRHLRMLGADLVFRTPFIGTMARRSGSTLADNCDAERLLRGGHVVGVWPEGFKGVGKPFSERYKLQRFGRGGFVAAALRSGVPIVPCSIVGAEEIYPMIGNMPAVARLLGLPYAPITPTFPLLGPLGLIPLPSKWLIEFGAPIDTSGFGPDAADDPMLVFDLTDQVRETIQQTLYSLLMQRKSVFV